MLTRCARFTAHAPRSVLVAALLIGFAAAIFGIPVAGHLSAGGQRDPSSDSSRVADILVENYSISEQSLVFVLSSDEGARSPAVTRVAGELERDLLGSGVVLDFVSAWRAPPLLASRLFSIDGTSGLIVAGIAGDEDEAQQRAVALVSSIGQDRDGVTVLAGGLAVASDEINATTQRDLIVAELIAVPLIFVALVWIFGGLYAAALPLLVGVFSILCSLSILRALTSVTSVSIFSLNLATALGLGLAVDYSLLIINRYREEVTAGHGRPDALERAMASAGRTVLFAALTVALSLGCMTLFPMYFLRSFAYAGVAVVVMSAVAALVIVPAVITVLGDRIDALDARTALRRITRRSQPEPVAITDTFFYRVARNAMAHAVPIAGVAVAALLILGLPFLDIKLGFPDDRALPASTSARQVGDELRANYGDDAATTLYLVLQEASTLTDADFGGYASGLSRVADVTAVSAPTGTYVGGIRVGPPLTATGTNAGTALLTVQTGAPRYSESADAQLDALRGVPVPAGGSSLLIGGGAQLDRDAVAGIMSRLPWVIGIIALVTFVLLFMLTGSVLLPIKALVLNFLSLTATFGALVWIFGQGHLGGLGTTPTGVIASNIPVLMFCIAFGLSMDYEVFLMSRIREYWAASSGTREDSCEAIALGVARTGRVITAAAVILSISFAALIAAEVSFIRMFGVGLTIAILVDATVIRMLLVPAFMRILGRANWWAPAPLARWHDRFAMRDEPVASPSAHAGVDGSRT